MSEFQLCPKCHGQGVVSIPPGHPHDLPFVASTQYSFPCDVCQGSKVLASPDTEKLKSAVADLTAALETLKEQTRWVPVSEDLPDQPTGRRRVSTVYLSSPTMSVGVYCEDCGTRLGPDYDPGDVCHACFESFDGLQIDEICEPTNTDTGEG